VVTPGEMEAGHNSHEVGSLWSWLDGFERE